MNQKSIESCLDTICLDICKGIDNKDIVSKEKMETLEELTKIAVIDKKKYELPESLYTLNYKLKEYYTNDLMTETDEQRAFSYGQLFGYINTIVQLYGKEERK